MFSYWLAMVGVLDFMTVSYMGAHVLDMKEPYLPLAGHLAMPKESLGWLVVRKSFFKPMLDD